jgi:hypothetical protein
MSSLTRTTAFALVLSLPAVTGAHAFNTTPVTYGPPNTTISSSVKPTVVPNTIYSQPNTTINSSIKPVAPNLIYSQPNTTINSSIKPAVVPNTIYSQPNTTINSSVKPYVVPNAGMVAPQATIQAIAAQAAAGKAAAQVTIASQATIAQNAAFVPKGAPTVLSQLPSSYTMNPLSSAETASSLDAMQNAIVAAQIAAAQMQSATDRQNILVNTQTSIFQAQQSIQQNAAQAAVKSANIWDPYFSGN